MTDESQEAFTRPPSVNAASALVRSSQRAAPAHPYFRSSTIPIFPSGPVVSPSILHDAVPPTAGISTDAHALTRTEGSAASGSPIKPATQYPGFNRSHGNDDVPNFWASASAGPFYRPSPVGFSFSPRGEPKRQRFGDTETPKSGPFSPSSGAFPPMLSSSSTHIRAMEEWIIALVDPESLRTIIEDSDAMSECVGGVPGLSGCTSQPFIHPTGGCSKVILRQFSRSLPCHHRSPTPSHSGHPAPHATSDRESGPSSFRAPTARCDGGGGGGGHAVPASRPPHDCTSMLQNQPTNPTSARLVAVADVASAAVLVFEQLPDGHNLDDDTVERLITQAKHVSDRRLLAAAGRGGTGGTKKRKGRDEGGHARRSLQEGPDRVSVGLDDRMRLFWKYVLCYCAVPYPLSPSCYPPIAIGGPQGTAHPTLPVHLRHPQQTSVHACMQGLCPCVIGIG